MVKWSKISPFLHRVHDSSLHEAGAITGTNSRKRVMYGAEDADNAKEQHSRCMALLGIIMQVLSTTGKKKFG